MNAFRGAGDHSVPGLRLKTGEMFVLCTTRLWTLGRACEGAEHGLRQGFAQAGLDSAAGDTLETLLLVLAAGIRPLNVPDLHAGFVTDDELALLSMLGAAQAGDLDGILTPLRDWLPSAAVPLAVRPAIRFAKTLLRHGLRVRAADDLLNGLAALTGGQGARALAPHLKSMH